MNILSLAIVIIFIIYVLINMTIINRDTRKRQYSLRGQISMTKMWHNAFDCEAQYAAELSAQLADARNAAETANRELEKLDRELKRCKKILSGMEAAQKDAEKNHMSAIEELEHKLRASEQIRIEQEQSWKDIYESEKP